jgi:hypothetical protein
MVPAQVSLVRFPRPLEPAAVTGQVDAVPPCTRCRLVRWSLNRMRSYRRLTFGCLSDRGLPSKINSSLHEFLRVD